MLKHVMGWLLSEIRLEGADIRKACLEGVPTAPGWSSEDLGGVGGVQQVRNLVLGGLERMQTIRLFFFLLQKKGRSQATEPRTGVRSQRWPPSNLNFVLYPQAAD